MPIRKLGHYSIRTRDLAASERFYVEVMDFRVGFRPAFPFPGVWLYQGTDESDYGIVHIIGEGGDAARGRDDYLGARAQSAGTGPLDHIAFLATGWPDMRARLRRFDVSFSERVVPTLGLLQIFLEDPSGIVVELNYPAAEARG